MGLGEGDKSSLTVPATEMLDESADYESDPKSILIQFFAISESDSALFLILGHDWCRTSRFGVVEQKFACLRSAEVSRTMLDERARVGTMQERHNTDKVTAALHFLIARFPPHQLGATKLNKILWFSDCEFYSRYGRSLTGETHYVRKPQGPWLSRFDSSIADLVRDHAIVERRIQVIDFVRREFYAQSEPDVAPLTSEELDVLVKMANEIAILTAAEVAESSHKVLWECLPPNAKMSIAAGAVTSGALDEADMEWARSVLA